MADSNEALWRIISGQLGRWFVPIILLIGGLIWLFSHLAAQPGTEVNVLWGMYKYFKGGQGATSGCDSSFEGRWIRDVPNTNYKTIYNLHQKGCTIIGEIEDSGHSSQDIHAIISEKKALGYTRRLVKDCVTYLADDFELVPPDRLIIKLEGGGCDLAAYNPWQEEFNYSRLPQ